jgi:hypothetical protein
MNQHKGCTNNRWHQELLQGEVNAPEGVLLMQQQLVSAAPRGKQEGGQGMGEGIDWCFSPGGGAQLPQGLIRAADAQAPEHHEHTGQPAVPAAHGSVGDESGATKCTGSQGLWGPLPAEPLPDVGHAGHLASWAAGKQTIGGTLGAATAAC